MDFDFSEEQEILRNSARQFLAAKCPASLVRGAEESGEGFAPELWRQMAELGWVGLAVPERWGGSAGSFFDLCLLAEEAGRALAPVPLIPAAICQYALMDLGTDAQKEKYLPRLASGELKMTPAIHDHQHSPDSDEIGTTAARKGDAFVLNGIKSFVPCGAVSDAFLIVARTGGRSEGVSLFIVDRQAAGLKVAPLKTIALSGQAELTLKDVKVSPDGLLGAEGKGSGGLKRLMQRGAILKCAEMAGGAQWVVEKTVQYAKDRVQFDRPIGTFQAIQHRCANMAMTSDGAKFVTYQAAWLRSENLPCEREVTIAKAWVSDAYTRICLDAHQAHGAIGFTNEYDLQLYTRRAKEAEEAFGDARHHYEALGSHMGL